jgi:hypothetical protein
MRAGLDFFMILPLVLAGFVPCASGQGDPCIRAYGAASVEQFLRDLQNSVAVDDRAHVVEMVGFPLKITADGKSRTLRNKNQLLEYYNVAFDAKVRGFIAKQKVSELFCNWKGIMIGRGEIWINQGGRSSRLRIIAINNNPPWSPEDN